MTNDYKNNILEYITNNITPTPSENKPLFNMDKDINIDLHQTIKDKLTELEGSVSASLLNCVVEETSQLIVFYGTYKVDLTEDNCYGYIYITDKDLNEIQMITKFSSGTRIFPIRCLNQDETGQFYGLSYDDTLNTLNNNARVLLLNNIFASAINGDYQVVLRQSYLIPNRNNYDFSISALDFSRQIRTTILKVPEEATYFIKCKNKATNINYVIRFTINVGSDNEWVATSLGIISNVYDILIQKEDEDYYYHIYSQYQLGYIEQVLHNDVLSVVKNFRSDYSIQGICAISSKEIYAIIYDFSADTIGIGKVTNSIIPIYTVNNTSDNSISIIEQNGTLFVRQRTYSSFDPYQVKVGLVFNDVVYMSTAKTWTGESIFFATISYNLVNIYVSTDDTTTKYILDFNPLNYNGLEYSSCNQTLATKARLYSNGEMVFARNLYDTTLLGAIATSNLQVPNTLLNGIPIVIESLVGATNGILINNSTPITKNIYETLYVNFIRSISVIDEDTNTQYPNTANYINQNINTANEQNCSDTFIGKVSINYSNSTIMQEITWTFVTDHYETSFVIDATNEVPTIDFLSNDETTMYISKELDITSGAYYLISQKLRIE